MYPGLSYIGLVVLKNVDATWWVGECTVWAVNVGLYLVWNASNTGRLWWIPPRVRIAIPYDPKRFTSQQLEKVVTNVSNCWLEKRFG